jgi:hypothetical protein
MPESYWQRKRRHLNEDHAARRAQSERTMGLIRSQAEIDRLAAATSGAPGSEPEFSETFRRLGVEWIMKKTAIMTAISTTDMLSPELKAEWLRVLEESTLTDRDDTPLEHLRTRVFREAMKGGHILERGGFMIGLLTGLGTLIDTRVQARAEF